MKFNSTLNNFSSGEWSPKMIGRNDVQQYKNACKEMTNFVPTPQGGAFRRPGTHKIVLDAAYNTDLQTTFSASTPFRVKSKMIPRVLASGLKQFLVCTDGQPSTTWFVVNATSPTTQYAITIGTACDNLATSASLKYTQVGDLVFIVDGTGVLPPRVWSPGTTSGGRLDLLDAAYALVSNPAGTRSILDIIYPFLPINAQGTSVNLTPSATTGAITITPSAAFFEATHIGAIFKFSSGTVTGSAIVTVYTPGAPSTVTATVLNTLPAVAAYGTAAGTSWEESAWSDKRGWPRTVTAHQGRVIYGGSSSYPDTIWGSRIGNVFDFMERPFEQDDEFTGFADDNGRPFTLTPNTSLSSNIRALSSDKTLVILTDRSEIIGRGAVGAFGPNDASFESSTSFGANTPIPAKLGNYLVYVQKGGMKLRDIIFDFEQAQYKSSDITFIAEHFLFDQEYDPDDTTGGTGGQYRDPIVEITGVVNENTVLYAKTQNGRLFAVALDRDYQITAWARIELGGSGFQRTYPLVKSICSVEGSTSEGDRLFMIVQRRINGSNVVMLEELALAEESLFAASTYAPTYIDSRVQATTADPAKLVWAGFSAYVGETLQVMGDKQFLGEFVVDGSGEITLTGVGTAGPATLEAGYGYTSQLETMPFELGQQVPDSPVGFVKRIDEVNIRFYNTYGAKYGADEDDLLAINFVDPEQITGDPPTMFSGIKTLKVPQKYSRECTLFVQQTKPWPCNVLTITATGVLYG